MAIRPPPYRPESKSGQVTFGDGLWHSLHDPLDARNCGVFEAFIAKAPFAYYVTVPPSSTAHVPLLTSKRLRREPS
jgi:hypothetical protein